MNPLRALVLGLLQGATEFIPVSSSGHLVLVPWLLKWPVPDLFFDTTVHLGTLFAVLAYFWRDFLQLARAWALSITRRTLSDTYARLAWIILIGSIPAAVIGYLAEDFFESLFGSPRSVSVLLMVTGLVLLVSERIGARTREEGDLRYLDAVLIGFGQACAIAPGISRSGATIASGLVRGLKRESAARFSFLLSTPIIFGAGVFKLLSLSEAGGAGAADLGSFGIGFVAALVAGYLCIAFLMSYLRRRKLYVFSAYCFLMGILCLTLTFVRP